MAKTMFGDIPSCAEHRKKNGLPVVPKGADLTCGEECPVAKTCKLRNTARGLQAAFGESEWS